MHTQIIINADDFGITKGASDSIISCHSAGSVTSTTLMTTAASAEYAALLAKECPDLGVGLHFNLTLGKPICPKGSIPGLTDDAGAFLDRGRLLKRCLLGKVSSREIAEELRAQFRRMESFGLIPTHVDSHQHVHMIPQVFRVVTEFSQAVGLPFRIPWRWQGKVAGKTIKRKVKEGVLGYLLSTYRRDLAANIPTNDEFCSIFDLGLTPDLLTLDSYSRLLAPYTKSTKPLVLELMVHPSTVDEELQGLTNITAISERENELLRAPEFSALVRALGFELKNYSCLSSVTT